MKKLDYTVRWISKSDQHMNIDYGSLVIALERAEEIAKKNYNVTINYIPYKQLIPNK